MTSNTIKSGTFTFNHAELGHMTGVVTPENVVQFRAVPYATIPARFKQSILLNTGSETNEDFTKLG
jgi:4-aminobutyrate aminotransferase-like enzyme